MSERRELAHKVVTELRGLAPFQPTAEIAMVWVLSAPGTIKEPSDDGIYNGESADLVNIQAGIDLVRNITALRLGKEVEAITKEDIEVAGPILFYNGEDKDTQNVHYLQNEALAEAVEDPDFPIPSSKIKIDHIDTLGTPAQVIGIANYLRSANFEGKIAVVTMVHHSMRVGRYLNHYRELLPVNVQFMNAWIPETVHPLGKTLREVRKIAVYAQKGDLSEESLEGF